MASRPIVHQQQQQPRGLFVFSSIIDSLWFYLSWVQCFCSKIETLSKIVSGLVSFSSIYSLIERSCKSGFLKEAQMINLKKFRFFRVLHQI